MKNYGTQLQAMVLSKAQGRDSLGTYHSGGCQSWISASRSDEARWRRYSIAVGLGLISRIVVKVGLARFKFWNTLILSQSWRANAAASIEFMIGS